LTVVLRALFVLVTNKLSLELRVSNTRWQYRLPILFSKEQIIVRLLIISSFRRSVCQESIVSVRA
ncbi:hypothetical protein T06_8750, partial [Trichinella sp. T6]